MPPQMNNPAQGGEFHGPAGIFYWWNGHGSHLPKNPHQWRVKVGTSQYGFNYYLGFPVPKVQLYDPNVNIGNPPPNGSTCWTVVEWKASASGNWQPGTPTSFTYLNP